MATLHSFRSFLCSSCGRRVLVAALVCLLLGFPALANSADFFGQSQHFRFRPDSGDRGEPTPTGESDFYQILGLSQECTEREIKTAYRKRAMQLHPDKGGNEKDFKKLVEAYEVLSDENKRAIYDRYGKEGLSGQSTGGGRDGMGPFAGDFRDFFRGFGAFSMPVVYNLELSLEDFFKGRSINIVLNQEKIQVVVKPGMADGTEIQGQIADGRGAPREVIFVLQEKPHSVFQRKNADLLMDLDITLLEALLGFEKTLTHLDNSKFVVRSKEGSVTSQDDVFIIDNLGMPVYLGERYDSGKSRGGLFIRIKIDMPRQVPVLSSDEQTLLQKVLGGGTATNLASSTRSTKPTLKKGLGKKPLLDAPVFEAVKSDIRKFGAVGASESFTEDYTSQFGSFFFR